MLVSPAQAGNLSNSLCGEYPARWYLDEGVDSDFAEVEKIREAVVYALRGSHP